MLDTARNQRLERAREALGGAAADWLIVPPSADFRWLTGAVARTSERLLTLVLPRTGEPFCIVPRLESDDLARACPWLELVIWNDDEDPFALLASRIGLERRPAVLIGEGMKVPPLLALAAHAACRPASEALGALRAVKDAEEIEALIEAGSHADRVVEEAADFARAGMTEREVARFVMERFEQLGDTDPWAIVASGPNSATPHHHTSSRRLAEGEVLLLDLGASTRGYGSDITRTFCLGEPSRQVMRVFEVVDAARDAGIRAARAGVAAEEVDRAARSVIESAGLGEHFTHRTGHGVGLDIHEPPYLVKGNRTALAVGNVHSVEPGVYLPGSFGVRIEDLVVIEEGGARRLNQAPRDLRPLRVRTGGPVRS